MSSIVSMSALSEFHSYEEIMEFLRMEWGPEDREDLLHGKYWVIDGVIIAWNKVKQRLQLECDDKNRALNLRWCMYIIFDRKINPGIIEKIAGLWDVRSNQVKQPVELQDE